MNDYTKLFSLGGKTAVITGGAGLLGKEMAKGLADFGAKVVVADIQLEKAREVGVSLGEQVKAEYLDITSEDSVLQLISNYERIDIWVNNAYPRTADWGAKFEDITFDSWRQNIDMHLNGYFLCSQKIALKMMQQVSGSIINMGSIYGLVGPKFSIYNGTGMTMAAGYSAIKGGVINFSRYLSSYLAPYNVRVNSLSPGGVYDNQPERFVNAYIQNTPLGRMATPQDLVGAVVFLASDASAYITGQNFVVDGGWTVC